MHYRTTEKWGHFYLHHFNLKSLFPVCVQSKLPQNCNISHTLVGNKIVDYSDVVGASPVAAAPTASSFSSQHLASMDWAKTTARWDEKRLSSVSSQYVIARSWLIREEITYPLIVMIWQHPLIVVIHVSHMSLACIVYGAIFCLGRSHIQRLLYIHISTHVKVTLILMLSSSWQHKTLFEYVNMANSEKLNILI